MGQPSTCCSTCDGDSPTRGRWHGEQISADNRTILYIPAGVAHGFQTLTDATEMDYEITPAYVPSAARGVHPFDPALAIAWPLLDSVLNARDLELRDFSSQMGL